MEKLASILSKLHLPGPGPIQLQKVQGVAQRILGPRAKQLRIGSYRRGCLVLEVKSAAQAFEWGAFGKQQLIPELRQIGGLEEIRDVRFRVGSWRENDHQ